MQIWIKALVFSVVMLVVSTTHAQDYFRISADFVTKVKPAEGKPSLTKGKLYYDKFVKELIYEISFPDKEKWVMAKDSILKIKNDSVYFSSSIPAVVEFTIFHLALNSNLTQYGFNESNFTISKVDKKGDMVISYWSVPRQMQKMVGSIVIAKKENRLYSVVIYDNTNKIINKQFFQNYTKIGGFEFPQTVVQIYYDAAGKEDYQMLEFKNIVLNDAKNEQLYHYKKPK